MPLVLKTAIPLCVLMLACVEQDEDKPTAEDMAAAKQNILTTAPTPKYAVNADLDGKVVYLGLDVDPCPIEPGKDVTSRTTGRSCLPSRTGRRSHT